MARVSVIIPTYNRANFVCEAIKSVLEQTFQDFEVIVVDDGSTDNTSDVIQCFRDHRIKYIYQQNSGQAAARNSGIQDSDSEYVAFLDSDDMLQPNSLEKRVQIMDKYPGVAFSYGQVYHTDIDGHVRYLEKAHKKSCILKGWEQIKLYLFYGNQTNTSTVMARRSCLEEAGMYDTGFREGSEDLDLYIRLSKKHAVAYIAEPLDKCRIHSGNTNTARAVSELEKKHLIIIDRVFSDPEVSLKLTIEQPKAYFHLYMRLASAAHGNFSKKTTRDYLFKALKICPKRFFFKSMILTWTFQYLKTWVPRPVLNLLRRLKYSIKQFSLAHSNQILGGN